MPKFSALLLAMLAISSAPPAAQAARQPAAAASKVWIRGELTYREPAVLPQDAVAVVELRELPRPGIPPRAEPVAVTRHVLSGAQAPVSFTIDADRKNVARDRLYVVHASIVVSEIPLWSATSKPLRLEDDFLRLDRLVLSPRPPPLARKLRCGPRMATLRAGDVAVLEAGPRRFVLRQLPAHSGVRYAADDDSTWLSVEGDRVRLMVAGERWEDCTVEPFRARGNEPGWLLELDSGLRFVAGGLRLEATLPPPQGTFAAARYATTARSQPIAVTIFERPCADSMSGMPFPHVVEVAFAGKTYRGCGGEPAALLWGKRWLVYQISGDFRGPWRMSLDFGADGRLSGRGPCNPYRGGYLLTGEGLRLLLGKAAQKRCDPVVLEQEQELFDLVQKTERFEIDRDGLLVLHTSDGKRISARPGKAP